MNAAAKNPITILAVDDHPLIRSGIGAVIGEQSDMTMVAEAANGEEAIEQYRQHKPDIVLMDLRMPVMNGLTAITRFSASFLKRKSLPSRHTREMRAFTVPSPPAHAIIH